MSGILSHPFRILPNGAAAAVEQASDEAHAEQLAVLALTRRGERDLAPGFGLTDPAFAGGFEPTELAAAVAAFGPPVELTAITVEAVSDSVIGVRVEFSSES